MGVRRQGGACCPSPANPSPSTGMGMGMGMGRMPSNLLHRERRSLTLVSLTVLLAVWGCPASATQPGSCDEATDSCCFSRVPHAEAMGPRLGGSFLSEEEAPKLRYGPPSWMRSCLSGVRTDAASAEHIARLVTTMFQDSYVAAGLDVLLDAHQATTAPSDSSSVLQGAPSTTVKPYRVQADVAGAIQEALRSSKLDSSEHHASFDLHYGLSEALRPLMDHNTLYETPFGDWALHRQVTLRPHKTQDSQQQREWRLHALEAPRALTEAQYSAVHGRPPPPSPSYEGLAVSHVNGIPASEYMQHRSDRLGGSRDPAGRLARLLGLDGSSAEPESLSGAPPPAADSEVFTFFGGVSETWNLTVSHVGTAETSRDLEDLYGDTEAFDEFSAAVASVEAANAGLWGVNGSGAIGVNVAKTGALEGEPPSPVRSTVERFEVWAHGVEKMVQGLLDLDPQSSSSLSLRVGDSSVNEGEHQDDEGYGSGYDFDGSMGDEDEDLDDPYYCDYGDCDYSGESYDYDDFTDMEPRALGGEDGVVQVALLSSGVPRASGGGFLGVYHLPEQQAIVVKVNGFAPKGGFYGPRLGRDASPPEKEGSPRAVLLGLAAAFGAAESYARRRGVERLLLDLSGAADDDDKGGGEGGGGGDSAYAAALFSLRYLQPAWRRASPSAARDLCDVAAFPMSEFSRALVDVAEGAQEGLLRLVAELGEDAASGEGLRAAGRAVARAGAAAARLLVAVAPGDEAAPADEALEAILSDPSAADGAVRGAVEQFVTVEVGGVIRSMVDAALGGASKRSLDDGLAALNGTRWLSGTTPTAKFSPFYFPGACGEALDAPLLPGDDGGGDDGDKEASPAAFEKAVVIVDGACGAACSTIAARMALSGSAYVVSHGGDGQTVLDVSPAARGGPQRWERHARSRALAALLLRAFASSDDEDDDGDDKDDSSTSSSRRRRGAALELLMGRLPGPLPSSAEVRFTVDGTFEPYLGKHAHPRDFYKISAGTHLPVWVESARTLPAEGESLEIVTAWKMASQFLSSKAPLLEAWNPAPSMMSSEELVIENTTKPMTDDQPTADEDEVEPTEEVPNVTAVSSRVLFRDMTFSDAVASEDSVVGAFADAAGIPAQDIVVVDFAAVPGGVEWNVTAVFSAATEGEEDDPAEAYVAALANDLSVMIAANDDLFRFQPELKGVVKTETRSAAAYTAAVQSERDDASSLPVDSSSSARLAVNCLLRHLLPIICLVWCIVHHSSI